MKLVKAILESKSVRDCLLEEEPKVKLVSGGKLTDQDIIEGLLSSELYKAIKAGNFIKYMEREDDGYEIALVGMMVSRTHLRDLLDLGVLYVGVNLEGDLVLGVRRGLDKMKESEERFEK